MVYFDQMRAQLKMAKKVYEKGSTQFQYADDWAEWYAYYLIDKGVHLEREFLANLLRNADDIYRKENVQNSWEYFVADYVTKNVPR